MNRIQELRDGIAYVRAELRSIDEAAGDQPLDADQQTRWDEGSQYVEESTVELRKLEKQAEERAALRELADAGQVTSTPGFQVMRQVDAFGGDVLRANTSELQSRAMKVLESDEIAGHLDERQRVQVERLARGLTRNRRGFTAMTVATMRPEYRSAFFKIAAGREWAITPEEARAIEEVEELRASLSTTAANGGYAIPQLLDPTVILTNSGSINPIRRVARVESGMVDQWEGVTSAGVTAKWVAEGVESTDGSPTLGAPVVPAHKANAVVTFSIEVGGGLGAGAGDWSGLSTEVSRMFVDAKERLETTAFATGSGNNQPTGIITSLATNTAVDVEVDTAGQLNAVDLRNTLKALPARYRANAAWMMSIGTALDIQNLGDDKLATQTGSLRDDPFAFPLLNKAAYENSGFSDFVAGNTGAQNILVVGDWSNYLVYDRLGATIELIPHKFSTGSNMPTGERMWYLAWRTGGNSINDSGFRILQNT